LVENRLLIRDQRHNETVIEVAHETLLRQWDVLAGWLQDERAALKEADALERQSREWKESGSDESWLWGGQRLLDAVALAGRAGFRKRLEGCSEFLERSRKQQEERDAEKLRVQTEKLKAAEELAAAQAAARHQAERNAIVSRSQALVAEARQVRSTLRVQSLLLASAAIETTRRYFSEKIVLPTAHQTLRDTLAGIGGDALVGHLLPITCIAFSADTRWVVTGSFDKTARLWDLKASDPSDQAVVLKGHEDQVRAVAFSPDNRWVVTGSADSTARLWDLKASDP